ncbi:hypothetical protein BUALT_Bualt18G0035300 [Buddleja alternifolia]|uniref:ATP synthase CF0 subunit I n=1 Tax=Buddleja alternifolia TaxID=168488 RepID=A0AAV6WAS6_9LAMI|nr:hypothetical protein BUALT_Bualt18G0035300 [Buddleja alternifolia]
MRSRLLLFTQFVKTIAAKSTVEKFGSPSPIFICNLSGIYSIECSFTEICCTVEGSLHGSPLILAGLMMGIIKGGDILRVFRKEKVETAIDEGVSRVLSMVESSEARNQYQRLLEKYRQAKAELQSLETDTASLSSGDISANDSISYLGKLGDLPI